MVNISAERKKLKADNRKQSEDTAELQVSTVYFIYSKILLLYPAKRVVSSDQLDQYVCLPVHL